MIYKRAAARLRAQDWLAITIELAIVILGVFVGTQVSNWNEARVERAETAQVLRGLRPELQNLIANVAALRSYYVVTRRYADTAFAGWGGDKSVSDREFVIAAYQASQNTFTGANSASWSEIFGGDRLRGLDDQHLRDELAVLMTTDFMVLEQELFTDYRQNVRKVIPEDIQDFIRAQCGDRRVGTLGYVELPATCTAEFPEERFRAAARALREQPQLVGEMRWHFAAVASYVGNLGNLESMSRRVIRRLEKI